MENKQNTLSYQQQQQMPRNTSGQQYGLQIVGRRFSKLLTN